MYKRKLTINLALTPFHKNAAGDFWTSSDSRDIKTFAYTYPELMGNPSNSTLVASIKKQYSGPADVPVSMSKREVKRDDDAGRTKELYLARVTLPIYGLANEAGGSSPYEVSVFVGDAPTDPRKFAEAAVGSVSAIGGTFQSSQKSNVTVDLSNALEKAIESGTTTREGAADFLKANLHYRLGLVSLAP
jgi:tyrosinase